MLFDRVPETGRPDLVIGTVHLQLASVTVVSCSIIFASWKCILFFLFFFVMANIFHCLLVHFNGTVAFTTKLV